MFIIKVNGNIFINSGTHYAVSWACGQHCPNAPSNHPNEYAYDSIGLLVNNHYTHIIDGDLILDENHKAVPYAYYVATGGISCSDKKTNSAWALSNGDEGAYRYFMDSLCYLQEKISNDHFINKAIYIEIFSLLELFLSDVLLSCIYSNEIFYQKAIDIFTKKEKNKNKSFEFIEHKIHEHYFKGVVYHQFEKVNKIYNKILNIDLPDFHDEYLHKRNNIVHRASLSGIDRMKMTVITEDYLKDFITYVKSYANTLIMSYRK